VPTYSEGAIGCDSGYSYPIEGTTVPPTVMDGAQAVPADTQPTMPNEGASIPLGPMYSRVIGDRKLEPGEKLNTTVALPVSSARKEVAQIKE
jgi:hypothetical protein